MQIGFGDESLRLEKLSQLGDSLERLNGAINWESFRPVITKVYKKEAKGPGGRLSIGPRYFNFLEIGRKVMRIKKNHDKSRGFYGNSTSTAA